MLSVSTIASLTSMFENWVFQYMSDPKHGSFTNSNRGRDNDNGSSSDEEGDGIANLFPVAEEVGL